MNHSADLPAVLATFAHDDSLDAVEILRQFIDWLRPHKPTQIAPVIQKIEALMVALDERPELREALAQRLREGLLKARHLTVYTDTGLFSRHGFFREFAHRLYERINPRPWDRQQLKDALSIIFRHPHDPLWVNALPDDAWLRLLTALGLFAGAEQPLRDKALDELLYATEMLSLWVAAEELEPELLRLDPSIAERDSPFVAQQRELSAFARQYAAWMRNPQEEFYDDKHARVLLDQCREQIARFRRRAVAVDKGSSLSLTHLLHRLDQTLQRIYQLLDILEPGDIQRQRSRAVALFKALLKQNTQRHSLSALWQDNLALLSRSVTEQASQTGEHYITSTRREYAQMFGAAAGAGFIIAFMALIKIYIMGLGLSTGMETLWVSLNYGLGFVLIHILHFTVATKQPAMTAAHFAAAIEASEKGTANEAKLAQLLIQVGRSQFAAVLGNVLLALPVAFLVGWAYLSVFGEGILSADAVSYHLHELTPLAGLALFHAAIAGVWLFVAGLIAGFFDNRCAYLNLAERLRANPHLKKILPKRLRHGMADYLKDNYGALAGNFLFGVLLGTTGLLGLWLGLPLDIRHIAFSSANLGYVVSVYNPGAVEFLQYFVFVLLIGAVNLWVSFALAFYVALKARGVRVGKLSRLLWAYGQQLKQHPTGLIFPPATPPANDASNSR